MTPSLKSAPSLRKDETLVQALDRLAAAAEEKARVLTERWHAGSHGAAGELEAGMLARSAEVTRARAEALRLAMGLAKEWEKRR